MKIRYVALAFFAFVITVTPAMAASYDLDAAHTRIGFAVRHMVISEVRGEFLKFSGGFDLDDKGALTNIKATVDIASINTRVEKRDKHLRSPDFFDAKAYPTMTFVSKKVTHKGNKYTIVGDLTIKKVTREMTLTGELLGRVVGFKGEHRAGFKGEGSLNRKDYGINFHALLEVGGMVVGDTVTILLDVEGIRK